MPRPPKFPVETIFGAIKDLLFFDAAEDLLPMSEPVWKEATKRMRDEMSLKHMYLYISRNDYDIQNMLRQRHNVKPLSKSTISKKKRSSDLNWSMDKNHDALPSLRVTITISDDDWNSIRPHHVSYKDRDYKVLRGGWTDVLLEQLWREHKLPCAYAFKNPKVNENPGEPYLWIKGSCTECGVSINLYASNNPTENGLILHVSTSDTTKIEHKKKRQLRGEKRKRVAKEVAAQSTYAWRRQKANELMEFGDKVPAHLYNEDTLRKAKQTECDRELGLRKGVVDPFASVRELKYRSDLVRTIREIGNDKFFAMYWSPEQVLLYKKHCEGSSEVGSLSIDATGSIIRKLPKPDGSRSTVYLYQGVIPCGQKILPVVQMVSEKHDANLISYWLREWLCTGVPYPMEIVCDYSLALLNAASLAFERTDLNTYVNRCFAVIEGSSTIMKPRSRIRIDLAHLIKLVTRWKCFSNTHTRVKEFFVRCVGLMAKCTTFEQFERLIRDTLTVAFAETEDVSTNDSCFGAQKRLIQEIKSFDEKSYIAEMNDLMEEKQKSGNCDGFEDSGVSLLDLEGSEFEVQGELRSFLQALENDCKSREQTGERANPYSCPDFARNLLRITKHFTLWTAVLARNGTTASSARSEEYFRELKQLTLKGDRNLRVDKFLIKHIRSISGTEKLLNANCNCIDSINSTSEVNIESNKTSKVYKNLNSHEIEESDAASARYEISKIDDASKFNESLQSHELLKFNESLNLNKAAEFDKQPILDTMSIANNSLDCSEERKLNDIVEFGDATEFDKVLNDQQPTSIEVAETIREGFGLPFLKNGNELGSVRIGEKDVTFLNTCPFDSLVQSLLAAYRDWAKYREYITSSRNELYDFVRTLSSSGITDEIYYKRAMLLQKKFIMKKNTVDCHCNIGRLVSRKLLNGKPSYKMSQECHDCCLDATINHAVVDVDMKPFYENNLQALESCVNKRIYNSRGNRCIHCQSDNLVSEVTSGPHMFIDIECLQSIRLAKNMGYANWLGLFTLTESPKRLIVGEVNYELVSAIEYIGSGDPESIGHYVAHIRRITGQWEIYNDMRVDNDPILATDTELIQKRKLSMLIYIRT